MDQSGQMQVFSYHSEARFALFALCFAIFWLGVIAYMSYSPPINTAEPLTWSRYAACWAQP